MANIQQGAIDAPAVLLTDELLAAYPKAKVILTNSDIDKWVESWRRTILAVMTWRSWTWLASWDRVLAGPWYSCNAIIINQQVNDWSLTVDDWASPRYLKILRQSYLDHYAHVRKMVPKERLLEFKSEDGWGPLCEFLGEEVPEGPYPYINESKDFVKFHQYMWYMALGKMILKTLMPVAIAGAAYYHFGYSGDVVKRL